MPPFSRIAAVGMTLLGVTLSGCSATPTPDVASGAAVAEITATTAPTQQAAAVAYPPSLLDAGDHVYFGVNLQWGEDSPADYTSRTGLKPEVIVNFFAFPLGEADRANLEAFFDEARKAGAIPLITLEPNAGLDSVTLDSATDFADRLAEVTAEGMPVMVRFAHEMNGSWYAWGQQPEAYVSVFRMLAAEVHRRAPLTAMLWAPNYGGGYPFIGGAYEAQSGSESFATLDTNGDGALTWADDPYAPYYPGDDAVDWVGMSLYHWGNAYPWGENEVPEANAFVAQLTGQYSGLDGDHTAAPDFYATYVEGRGKPMAVPETAALFNTTTLGLEADIKSAWWEQIFSDETRARLPGLRMVNWFEWRKSEPELAGAVVDWRASAAEDLAIDFAERVQSWLEPRE